MVGGIEDAAHAARGELDLLSNVGGDRCVYRSGDVVYKVERDPDPGRAANEAEHRNSVRFAGERHILPTSLYRIDGVTVLAMPYFPLPTDPFPEGSAEILALRARFGDVTSGNTRRDGDGCIWIIDFPGLADGTEVAKP